MSTRSVHPLETNMARIGAFLKNAWNKEPVILASCGIAVLGVALPFISPITKYSGMINSAVPYNYPVPVRDDGNMPDVPAHPCEPKGNNLEWLKTSNFTFSHSRPLVFLLCISVLTASPLINVPQ